MTHMYAYSRTVSTTAMYTFNLVSWLIPRLSHTFFLSLPNAELALESMWPYTIMDWRLPDQPHTERHDRGDTVRGSSRYIRGSQGSVLGPLLFICYINDPPTCVSSDIRLFADDCLLYRTIHFQHDAVILQEDLNMLQQWEAKWLMSFNPDKCEVLRVNNKRKHIIHMHPLQDTRQESRNS